MCNAIPDDLERCSILSGTMFHLIWNKVPAYMEHEYILAGIFCFVN